MRGTYRQTEAEFQQQVVQLARLCGWAVFHPWLSVKSSPGWPDLALCRTGRLIFAELKSEKGQVTVAQQLWLDLLGSVDGIEVYVWRPSDFEEISRVLQAGRVEGVMA